MKSFIKRDVRYLEAFHTQEKRRFQSTLIRPIKCTRKDAWLGHGWYFWADEEFAHFWGEEKSKVSAGYIVYRCDIEDAKLLNTAYNQKHDELFKEVIETTINKLNEEKVKHFTLEHVHRYIFDKELWKKAGINGIIYADTPNNPRNDNEKYSSIHPLYYKKRIQIVAFSVEIIHNFALHSEH